MKILIVHYNPAAPGQAGGAESAIRDQRLALERLGCEVETEFSQPERAYVRFRPDIVHFHTIHVQMGLNVLQWAQRAGVKHCLSLHDYWPFCSGRMLLKKGDQSCSAVTGLCDGRCEGVPSDPEVAELVNGSPVVTFNPNSAAIYRRHGIRVDAVIPHAIDTNFFAPDPSKRTDVHIMTHSAWPQFPTKGMHILRAALKEIGAKARLVTGLPREAVRDELQSAAIHVFPSCYEETWGLCLTEAMACGCACIASDVCGPKAQIEHGVNGLLFPNRDSHALAMHLKRLLENDEEREWIGAVARNWAVTHCNLERMGRDYLAFYKAVINGT